MNARLISKTILKRCFSTDMAPKKIEFFYDCVSPYSWYAFEVLMRYKKHWNITVDLKPFFLPGIMKATGNSSPLLLANKGINASYDLTRNSKYFNVPLKVISDPFTLISKGSLIPCRFLTAVDILYPDYLENVSRALWMKAWNEEQDFTTLPVLAEAGLKSGFTEEQLQKIQKQMTEQETKDRLKANTELALDYFAFGAPTIIAHIGDEPQLFFGSDRFPLLAMELGEKWVGPEPDALQPRL